MKKTIFALTIASLLSAPALASKEGFYIGADIASNSYDGDSFDTGVGLVAGYDFQITPQVVIGVEGEYRNFGEDKHSDVFGDSVKHKAYSYGINVKPKYYFNDNFYAGAQVGLHNLEEELKFSIEGDNFKFSDNNTVLSLGVEAGYDFNRNVSIKGGYKSMDSDYGSFYIGANYKF